MISVLSGFSVSLALPLALCACCSSVLSPDAIRAHRVVLLAGQFVPVCLACVSSQSVLFDHPLMECFDESFSVDR